MNDERSQDDCTKFLVTLESFGVIDFKNHPSWQRYEYWKKYRKHMVAQNKMKKHPTEYEKTLINIAITLGKMSKGKLNPAIYQEKTRWVSGFAYNYGYGRKRTNRTSRKN